MPGFRNARHGTTNQRGYGYRDHQKPRAQAFAALPEWSPCCRCHRTMWKWAKDERGRSALHWDHNDQRDGYLGFAHDTCNRKAGAANGGRAAAAHRRPPHQPQPKPSRWTSRRWL